MNILKSFTRKNKPKNLGGRTVKEISFIFNFHSNFHIIEKIKISTRFEPENSWPKWPHAVLYLLEFYASADIKNRYLECVGVITLIQEFFKNLSKTFYLLSGFFSN